MLKPRPRKEKPRGGILPVTDIQASYLEDGQFSLLHSQGSDGGREKFVLSLKEDLDNVGVFIAANRFSDLLVNVNLDETETESASVSKTSSGGVAVPLVSGSVPHQTSDLSTGLLSFSHIGDKDTLAAQATVLPVMMEEEEGSASEGTDSERCSGSIASFLANEKLMSLDGMNSDMTDDDIDVNQLHDEELELYFNKLMPPAMQRGRVEGQEIPVELPSSLSQPHSTEPEWNRHHDDYDQRDFHMPDVRLAATGMDSCPASDEEDTEDELEASRNRGRARFLLPSISRQPVGESRRPHFRPGLEGGSSDDELQTGGRNPDTRTGIEHRRSAEGQVINSPITGDGGGDGSSGSDEEGNGGVSSIPLPPTTVQSTYDVLRGLGIVGGSGQMGHDDQLQSLLSRSGMIMHGQMGDRVGPVGTGETGHATVASGPAIRCPVNWSMSLDRQEALDAMDNTAEVHLDSVYLRAGAGHNPQDISSTVSPFLQGTQSSFHLSQVLQESHNKTEQVIDLGHTVDLGALGMRGGPCGDSPVLNEQQSTSSKDDQPGESLDARYLCQSFDENHEEHNDIWNHQPDNLELELQQGTNATHSVVYQNEEGKWVTDLAYYSSFEKELEANMPEEVAMQFQSEDFLAGSQAMDKIIEDQEEFEKDHQFMQEEQIQAVNMSEVLGDTSWKIPSSSNILMRASQVSSELEPGNQSYLRISLGEFFQRRSEALGCLGSAEEDNVKRPSFGYFITSPEKRKPVALLRPSDLFSRGSSINIETVTQSDADETLNPDDLDKTLETNTAEATHENNVPPQRTEGQVSQISAQYGDKESSGHSESPNPSSSLLLSISTIASAIADASISSDPAQLAAMIMELSKRSRSKSRQQVAEESIMSPDSVAAINQNGLLEDLQKTTSVGDLSTPDMEKYLKRAEVSSSDSDGSTSQSCLDILTLADSLASSNKLTQQQLAPLENGSIHNNEEQAVGKTFQKLAGNASKQTEGTYVVSPNPRSDVKRSAIPRPKSSSLPTTTVYPAKRSLGSGQSSSSTSFKSKTVDFKSGIEKNKNDYRAAPSTNKSVPESKIKIGTARSPVASTSTTGNRRSLKGEGTMSTPAFSPKTSPGLCRFEVSSLKTSPHKPKTTGGRADKPAINQARSPRSPKATQSVSKEKIAAVDRQDSLPTTQEKFGSPESSVPGVVEVTHCNFRPSTSPLTHSSPSQTSVPSGYGEMSPCSPSSGKAQRSPAGDTGSPQSHCSSPSLSRLTYLSINENTCMPTLDHHKVESLPFQWLIVKNKTIIGPKCTEEQRVLFIAPRSGLYQYTLSVSSWPASAESETVAHAEVFAKKVVLIAVAENPVIEVDVGKTGCLDFWDMPGGSSKALPLKLVNRTHATVPIRLVISANASAWHCFGFSKSPVAMTTDGSLHTGSSLTSLSTSSVINHVLHASYAENQESCLVWVHFSAPQKYISSSGELGPADEYSARVDIEVDSPGPSHVIQSVALRARSGTPRVHAPKDLQTVCLQAPLGQTAKQTLPLKNAGNIDVLLRVKSTCGDSRFTVRPEELTLKAGEEQGVVVSFTAQDKQKLGESMLTILVLPSGPQYEVMLKGETVQGVSGKVVSLPAVLSQAEVPPILSNKQFMAWGGVTLGRAVQQKLVLRNNSPTTSQQLRLLIRGQDQDCFQLQSSFGPDERLTRNRELSIKPKEDVTVHLLFAPTRVASMLAKLEIKQSAARASQPGVKFTIPLSGYGGTSNVILEELRKRSEGYVATLSGVQAGRVRKLCVCVRNTGSRAAFVKAVSFSNLQNRAVMDSTIISLSPSQFVLKERTQEVITIAMKASRREQAICQSGAALLATVCLFCGDEVSRQQFRKLLQIKPEAGNKVLSENSLLKSIPFDEMFLGEEQVQEAYDLPQRPNEAQIFYSNMSKVMLSLFGTMEMSDSGESDHMESVRPSQRHTSESDSSLLSGLGSSGRYISNVSLDVLPVKGPPLSPSEPVLKQTELNLENTWSIKPEQLVLTAPTINSVADTRHVQILNRSNRELSFELSWPAHCLTITPQHGVIEPQSHLQILISPNPSLATKSSMLPWSGQIYVQCDNQQKSIKVQIRQDLAMDVSATSCAMDRSLRPLPPQAETPLVPGQKLQSSSTQPQVEIKNRTLVFPPTASGESSECSLEVENHGEEVRWYLSSFAPPYVKGVDSGGDVYRATYSAFRCEKASGTLGIQERMQVPFAFLPRDRGDYAQFWDLECHPTAKPQHKSRVRFQLCGAGIRAGEASSVKENCSLVKTEATVKNRKRLDSAGSKTGSSTENQKRGVYAPQSLYTFPATRVGATSTLKVNFRNNSSNTHELKFISPKEPFHIKHSNYSLRSQHYINLPVQFVPATAGQFSGTLLVQTDTDAKLIVELSGEALP
ncbi:centrosomal protein of 192 kDa-like [Sinocyclocheilus grahami]|uniref:centrosomal protein of 192 kDa-like n=1 Tax=Sinocyclocheilus grahami TaxID=75366 RepID=UPI0007AD2033|nr:PREDICTED: centrosomal protein of 192 kDa-like [Sinocyclocheilus grahami]